MKKVFTAVILVVLACGCAQQTADSEQRAMTLGYLQVKSRYSAAAIAEGGLPAIKKVLDNKHSRTGKPYPCWNALKPYKGKNLPVSLSIQQGNGDTGELFLLSGIDQGKLDMKGSDGSFYAERPPQKGGYATWQIDLAYKDAARSESPAEVIGLVDISGSMGVKRKINTLRALKDLNVNFAKLYGFSDRGRLEEVNISSFSTLKPSGKTALYDNLIQLLEMHPGSEIAVVTDGKDNRSKTSLSKLLGILEKKGQKIDVVLTSRGSDTDFFKVAKVSGGKTLSDRAESGKILNPALEVTVEK